MIVYFLKASIITALLYSFYRLLLYNTTFHSFNRYYLLFIIPFSLICPVLAQVNILNHQLINNSLWIDEFQEISQGDLTPGIASIRSLSITSVLIIIYLSGVLLLLFRFLGILYKIIKLKRFSLQSSCGKYFIIITNRYNAPFSFFNRIFLPAGFEKTEGSEYMVEHEIVHSKQLHSLDLIITEIFCIAFWFNPFVFLLKKSLKSIHEYLADSEVIKDKTSLPEYLKLLVASSELSCLSGITNHFKHLPIKKRIEMITKNKTSKFRKCMYLLIVPIIVLMIQAFSMNKGKNNPPEIRPVEGGEITLKFGFEGKHPITNKDFVHGGIDIKAPIGTKVISAASGEVIEASVQEGWGNLIVIKHDDTYETWYAHLDDFSVQKGDWVKSGQVIGHVGNTGYSTGSHLHYEIRKNGGKVDPEDFFK